jgi:hypothetical protein
MATTARRRGVASRAMVGGTVGGVLTIVAGAVVAIVMFAVADARVDDAVERLARAPSGCETTLDVDDGGTYLLFVETQGSIDELDGGCDVASEYTMEGQLPRVRLDVADPDGDEVDLDRVGDVTYDAAGFTGTAIRQVELERSGRYVVTVESPVDVVVSIGRDPDDAAGPFPVLGILSAVLGVLLGVALLVVAVSARRRPAAVPATPAPGTWWQPVPGAPPVGPPQVPPPGPPIATPGSAPSSSPWARPPTPGTGAPAPGPSGPPAGSWPPPPPSR